MTTVPTLALTPAEAAEALGIPLAAFEREVLPTLEWLELDGAPRIPVARLQQWLAWRSGQASQIRTKAQQASQLRAREAA